MGAKSLEVLEMKRSVSILFFSIYLSATALGQENIQSLFSNGTKLARVGQFEKALAEFATASKLADAANAPSEMRAHLDYNLAVCHYQLGRIGEAVTAYEAAIRRRPTYEKAFYALGMAEAERQNWPSAEKAFIRAIAINRRNPEAWFDLGYVYLAKLDFAAAKTAFELAARYKSVDTAVSHNNIGVILAAYGDNRRAIAEFERALRLSDGQLDTAARNLEICRQREIIAGKSVAANMEFGRRSKRFGD